MKYTKFNRHKVQPGTKAHISQYDSSDTSLYPAGKSEAKKELDKISQELSVFQDMLYAEHKNKLLIIFQAMDTGGKDGTIKTAFSGFNPSGVRVISYKVPTTEELDHDYLWRVHKQTPSKGEIVIFNRSHYEDVLAVRVHEIVPEKVWKKRYEHINNFEKLLIDEGTTILKFFLNISKDEQKKRLEERLNNPAKNWKFNIADIEERKLWQDYMDAYEDVINKTSTSIAPWYIIPSDKNWYRNLAVASITAKTLKNLNISYPSVAGDLRGIVIK
jgi:PPK2 family polyphosphate:nucleotide phosphotransferase